MNSGQFLTRLETFLWNNRVGILTAIFSISILRFWLKYDSNANEVPFAVADLLINYADGFVRRGLLGETALHLSSVLGWSVTGWAMTMTTVITISAFFLSVRLYRSLPKTPSLLVLVLAPWGFAFAAYDENVFFRKEYLGYLALLLILTGTAHSSPRRALQYLVAATLLYPVSIIVHEGNAALAGSMLVAVGLMIIRHPSKQRSILALAGSAIVLSAIALIAVFTNSTADSLLICSELGITECDGPFPYLEEGASDGINLVLQFMADRSYLQAGVVVILTFLPFAGFRLIDRSQTWLLPIIAAIAIPILPLFFVGVDSGRWIQMIAFPASLLALTAVLTGIATYHRIFPVLASILYCSTWGIHHVGAQLEPTGFYFWIGVAVYYLWYKGKGLALKMTRVPVRGD